MEKTILEEDNNFKKSFFRICKGTFISVIITIILLLIFSSLLTYTEISEKTIPIGIIIITGISILIGSFISTLKVNKNGIINGIASAGIYFICLYAISGIENGFLLSSTSLTMILVSLALGAIGGIIGVNVRK